MMGIALKDDRVPVVKAMNCLLALPAEGEASSFLVEFEIEEPVSGFRYSPGGSASDS